MVPPLFLLLSKTLRGKSFVILNLAVRRRLGTKAKPFMEFQIVILVTRVRTLDYTVVKVPCLA